MTLDLFDERTLTECRDEPLSAGAVVLRGFALATDVGLVDAVTAIAAVASFRHMVTPSGHTMSVAMTNCGALGWVSDRAGYRYAPIDPLTGRAWPASAVRSFRIATSDYGAFVLAPKLLGREWPNVDLWIRALDASFEKQLARGEADVVVAPRRRDELPVGIRSRPLYRERFVCLVRKGNPLVKKGIDLGTWTSMHHVSSPRAARPAASSTRRWRSSESAVAWR